MRVWNRIRKAVLISGALVAVTCTDDAGHDADRLGQGVFALSAASNGFTYPMDSVTSWTDGNFGACGPLGPYITDHCHTGNDMIASRGTSVYSVAAGTAIYQSATQDTSANCPSGWGYDYNNPDPAKNEPGTNTCNMALLVQHYDDHGTPFVVMYGHLVYSTTFRSGTGPVSATAGKVIPGQVLGIIGRYRNVTGGSVISADHLHFGVRPGTTVPSGDFGRSYCPSASQKPGPTLPSSCALGANGFVPPGSYLNASGRSWVRPPGVDASQGYLGKGYSQSFFDAWVRGLNKDSNGNVTKSLGGAFDNGGTAFVHDVRGVKVQDFLNPDASTRYGTDGQTAIVYNATDKKAYFIHDGFWGAYKCIQPPADNGPLGGLALLGAPKGEEKPANLNDVCVENAPDSAPVASFQSFENGCMWWKGGQGDSTIHVHLYSGAQVSSISGVNCGLTITNNPPGPGWYTISAYADALASGWQDWSWGSTRTLSSTERVYLGAKAIKVVFAAWGGLFLATPSGATVSSATRLRIAVNGGATGGQHPIVQLYDTAGALIGQDNLLKYVPGGALAANTWHLADIPLLSLGLAGTAIGGFAIESDVATTMYFDEARFQDVWLPAAAYGDSLAANWEDWSWGSTRTLNSTEQVYLGSSAIKVAYAAWGGLYLANPSSVDAGSITRLRFAVNGGPTGGQHPTVQLYDTSGGLIGQDSLLKYVPGGTLAANTWYLADVPLASLGLTGLAVGGFAVMSDVATTMYFDEVRFQDVALKPPVYADYFGPGWYVDMANSDVNLSEEKTFLGSESLKVLFFGAGRGFNLQRYPAASIGTVAKLQFVVHGGSTGGQNVTIKLADQSTGQLFGQVNLIDYVPGHAIAANAWYRVEIPFSALGFTGGNFPYSILFQTDAATTMFFDEIRIQ